MATILGSITINDVSICEISGNPTLTGLDLPTGSLAINTDNGTIYAKSGNGDFDWTDVSSGSTPPSDVAFIFEGSISVQTNSRFTTASSGIGIRVKKFSTRVLDINGSFTVSLNGRCSIGTNSNVTVRSI
jgi:hypothetical protein